MSDNELVQMVKNRDEKSFEELRRRHREYVEKVAYNTGYRAEAEDLQQDIWLRVWEKIHQFRAESGFRTWLTRIVINYVNMGHRKTRRKYMEISLEDRQEQIRRNMNVADGSNFDAEHYDSALAITDENLASVLTRIRLKKAWNRLPKVYKACIFLAASGVEYKEISDATGITVPAIKSRVLRGRAMLTEIMQTV